MNYVENIPPVRIWFFSLISDAINIPTSGTIKIVEAFKIVTISSTLGYIFVTLFLFKGVTEWGYKFELYLNFFLASRAKKSVLESFFFVFIPATCDGSVCFWVEYLLLSIDASLRERTTIFEHQIAWLLVSHPLSICTKIVKHRDRHTETETSTWDQKSWSLAYPLIF